MSAVPEQILEAVFIGRQPLQNKAAAAHLRYWLLVTAAVGTADHHLLFGIGGKADMTSSMPSQSDLDH